jgi:hypothetical protein
MVRTPGSALADVTWQVVATETPRIVRRCPRCDRAERFVSSDRFRLNASGRRVDVWLIYRCVVCEHPFKLTVFERQVPARIPQFARYQNNDTELAWACAFDAHLVAGLVVDRAVPFHVEGPPIVAPTALRLVVPHPLALRLDRLLAAELGVPRARVAALVAGDPRAPVRHDARVIVRPP